MKIGKAKNILGKPTYEKIGQRAAVLKGLTGKSLNSLGKEAGLSNATADDWSDNQIEKPTRTVSDFLKYHNINEGWWKTGNGDIFIKNGTYTEPMDKVKIDPSMDELIANLMEGNTAYILMNRELILEKYRLVAVDQLAKQENDAQRKHQELLQELQNAREEAQRKYEQQEKEAQRKYEQYEREINSREKTITVIMEHLSELTKKIHSPLPPPTIQSQEVDKA